MQPHALVGDVTDCKRKQHLPRAGSAVAMPQSSTTMSHPRMHLVVAGKVLARHMTTWFVERALSMRRLLMPIATVTVGLVMVSGGGAAQDRLQPPKSGAVTIL